MKNARRRKRVTATLVAALTSSAALVTNHGSAKPDNKSKSQFTSLSCNTTPNMIRNDTMEGKPYVVVPMVMMLEGVHQGSGGPLYYPADELAKTPEVWNCKPVVVYHPTKDGRGISACSPEVLNSHRIGVIMNTKFDSLGRLTAEAWLEEDRVRKVDERIWNAIEEKKVMELSTGLFTDNEMTEGEYDGEKYIAIARNYRPDHLAVLPDKIGACSVADGAGFCRNELIALTGAEGDDLETLREFVVNQLQRASLKKGPLQNVLKKYNLVDNEASHEQIREQIYHALEKKFPPPQGNQAGYSYPYVEAVYDNEVVYCMGGKIFKIGYSKSDAGVKLTGEPTEVRRVLEYRTVSGSSVTGNAAGHSQQNQNHGDKMNKKELVDGLIANGGYSEESRSMLMGLDETVLKSMTEASTKLTANAKSQVQAPAPAAAAAPATNAEKKPATHADFLAAAPAETQAIIRNAERVLNAEKEKHVATITANSANKFSKEQLMAMDVGMLESLAALATNAKPAEGVNVPNFQGAGMFAAPAIQNNGKPDDQPLVMAPMEFKS